MHKCCFFSYFSLLFSINSHSHAYVLFFQDILVFSYISKVIYMHFFPLFVLNWRLMLTEASFYLHSCAVTFLQVTTKVKHYWRLLLFCLERSRTWLWPQLTQQSYKQHIPETYTGFQKVTQSWRNKGKMKYAHSKLQYFNLTSFQPALCHYDVGSICKWSMCN